MADSTGSSARGLDGRALAFEQDALNLSELRSLALKLLGSLSLPASDWWLPNGVEPVVEALEPFDSKTLGVEPVVEEPRDWVRACEWRATFFSLLGDFNWPALVSKVAT
mmetsp:Transcript_20142/g.51459  ORF Transcript_20142/g.51459 Transcript_20142/m.51459 type:complete len:109 (+) Transcript_20142:1212-1538(+)